VLLAADRVYAFDHGHALEVSIQALRERHEEAFGKDADEILSGLAPAWAFDGGQRSVLTMPKPGGRKETEDEEDDSEEDDD
ncbi:MAG: hypothetical protein ACRDTR_21685, partial [Rubrobacter sp.]